MARSLMRKGFSDTNTDRRLYRAGLNKDCSLLHFVKFVNLCFQILTVVLRAATHFECRPFRFEIHDSKLGHFVKLLDV